MTKTCRILTSVFFLSLVSLGGQGWAQQCVEESVQVARLMMMQGVPASAPAGDGCGTAGLIHSWHCENIDITNASETALGACVSAGEDTSATLNSGAALDTDGSPTAIDGTGTYGGGDGTYNAAIFSTATTTLVAEGAISGYVYLVGVDYSETFFSCLIDSNNYVRVQTGGSSSDVSLIITHKGNGTLKDHTLVTTSYDKTTDAWYYFEAKWKANVAGNDTYLKLCKSDKTECDEETLDHDFVSPVGSSTTFQWGFDGETSQTGRLDILKLYNTSGF